jgi:hypothetical protein
MTVNHDNDNVATPERIANIANILIVFIIKYDVLLVYKIRNDLFSPSCTRTMMKYLSISLLTVIGVHLCTVSQNLSYDGPVDAVPPKL